MQAAAWMQPLETQLQQHSKMQQRTVLCCASNADAAVQQHQEHERRRASRIVRPADSNARSNWSMH